MNFKNDLKQVTKLEILLLIKDNNIPKAVAKVMSELGCSLNEAKAIVEKLKNEIK